ncbi:hypothetical protein ACQEVB_18980 [Pseudonocardia sp. CA-107938]|uniref:hypothetical protein n=1 Tax=Pseudonocardia sp. CA-107938 TaxID=3240021 RepID=UPI003D945241
MSYTTFVQNTARASMGVLAAAVLAGLAAPTAAAAEIPVRPAALSATCDKYEFAGLLQMEQPGGYVVQVPASGDKVGGRAAYAIPGRTTLTLGTASGGITGRAVDFTVTWDEGVGAGVWGHYTGQIGDDGHASGTTTSSRGDTSTWRSSDALSCVTPATSESKPGPIKKMHRVFRGTATVTDDVDLYSDDSGDDAKKIGFLEKGRVVKVVKACTPDAFCELADNAGWAWGEFLRND